MMYYSMPEDKVDIAQIWGKHPQPVDQPKKHHSGLVYS